MTHSVLITGGAGFIGRSLVRRISNDFSVTVLDTFGGGVRLEDELRELGARVIRTSVADTSIAPEIFDGFDTVVHAAGVAGVDQVTSKPVSTIETNLFGSFNLLNKIRQSKANPRIILFSTSEVYGPFSYRSRETESAVIGGPNYPRWHYAAGKFAMEHIGFAYSHEFNLRVGVVRPFNVFGPGQSSGGAISRFIQLALKGENLTVHGDGLQLRAWCYIDDFVDAIVACIESDLFDGEILNVGNPANLISTHGLARLVVSSVNTSSQIEFVDQVEPPIDFRLPDISKAVKLLQWEPKIPLEDGIRMTLAQFEKHL